jgi:N-acetylmuramoyl-L-alanine amidase-like protein
MALISFTGSPHGGSYKLLPEWDRQPRITPTTIIDHSIVGSALGAWYYFRDSTGIESHFIVRGAPSGSADGHIWQLMDTSRQADANLNANAFAISIETEDNGDPDHFPWSQAQLASLRWLHAKLRAVHPTIPRRRCPSPRGGGLGYHTMWGAPSAWTPVARKTCPGRPARVAQWEDQLLPAFLRAEEDDVLNDDDRRWIHGQLQHFGMLLMAGRTGTVFNSSDLQEFHFRQWRANPELRDEVLERMTQVLYRLLKGQNSVFNDNVFPSDEPQENIRDLAARLEVLQQSVEELRAQLGLPTPTQERPPP